MIEKEKIPIPQLTLIKEQCCGCAACAEICPKNAIVMNMDEEGFYYPVIDSESCVGCETCLNVCAFKVALNRNSEVSVR